MGSCSQEDPAYVEAARLADRFVEDTGISGLAISVGIGDTIVWSAGFGYADIEQRVPISPASTRFRVGSVAKPMTALAVAQLHESGKLDLDAPVQQYVPGFPVKTGSVTTRLLGGHLAGIRSYREGEYFNAIHYHSVEEALSIFADDALEHAPGSKHLYSSYGFNLISAVVEGASGMDFLSYMSERVFTPLGMTQTVADDVVPTISNRSRYYELENGELVNAPWVDNSVKWAGGGFLSTSEDLLRLGFAHLTDEYLEPETIEMLWSRQATDSGEQIDYGIGWRLRTDDQGRRVVFHGGSSVGGATDFHIYPESGLVIAAISNTSAGDIPLEDSLALVDAVVELFWPGAD